jgi:hypothetical protein
VQQQMMHMQWLPFTEGAVWIPGKLQGRAVLAACSVRTAFEQHLSISCSVCMRGIVQTCGQGWLWRELRTCLQAGAGGGFAQVVRPGLSLVADVFYIGRDAGVFNIMCSVCLHAAALSGIKGRYSDQCCCAGMLLACSFTGHDW